jgi:hypothetical protein
LVFAGITEIVLTGFRDFDELLEHEKEVINKLKININGKVTGFFIRNEFLKISNKINKKEVLRISATKLRI